MKIFENLIMLLLGKNIPTTIVLILLLLCSSQQSVFAQVIDPGRGMYVDDFLTLNNPNSPGVTSTIPVPALTILGTIQKENDLFSFCSTNHITTIVLYDLRNVFASNRVPDLCSFISRAKLNGIVKVGGTVAAASTITDESGLRQVVPTPTYIFTADETNFFATNTQYSWLQSLLTGTYSQGNPQLEISEYLKSFWDIARLNNILSSCAKQCSFGYYHIGI